MTSKDGTAGCDDASLVLEGERLRRAQRIARLGSWELDLRSGIMWGSDEACRLYGLTPTEDNTLPYEIVKKIPLPEHRGELDRALDEIIRHGTPYETRFRIRRHDDGEIRHIHSFAGATLDEKGNPSLITGTIQDVTEQVEANRVLQDALRANEERARLILEQAADAIFICGADYCFTQVNRLACELTGYRQDELLGCDFTLLFGSDVLAREPLRTDQLERGETVFRERLLSRKDGSRILVEMRSKRLPDKSYQSIVRDISERRRLEEQVFLRQRMDSLGTLASGIAHDFNNILAVIVGYTESLEQLPNGDDIGRRRKVASIVQSCRRAADLIRSLQMFTRATPVEMENFDLHNVASEVFRVLDETTDRIIQKEMTVPKERFPILGNPSAVYHALMNLGINAVQAIEAKGPTGDDRVRIAAEDCRVRRGDALSLVPGRYVHITLQDTGIGMPPEVQERAFDLLYSTKEVGERKGQGMGLAVVYNVIVRHHHGLVDIASDGESGTTFHLYLPRGTELTSEDASLTPVLRGGDETVLVIDDEIAIADVTREVLEALGYTVLMATDGERGLRLFSEHQNEIDLVLLDRTMPKMSGEQVLRRMLEVDSDVKVIVSTGDTNVDLSMVPGAVGVMHKPFRLAVLFDTIREALDS